LDYQADCGSMRKTPAVDAACIRKHTGGLAMSWLYLVVAGIFEIGWPLGLKYGQNPDHRIVGIAAAVASMAASGVFLWLAQREIPMGTAYAVWTGIGAAGTFMLGVLLFGDATSLGRFLGVGLIIAGVVTLKLSH
jgi:quaternary ammonium compound-resistance protein SugE